MSRPIRLGLPDGRGGAGKKTQTEWVAGDAADGYAELRKRGIV